MSEPRLTNNNNMKIAIFVLLVAFAATAFASVRFPRAAGGKDLVSFYKVFHFTNA